MFENENNQKDDTQQQKELLDLVYDLESYIIDLVYENDVNEKAIPAGKQAALGKKKIADDTVKDSEVSRVCSIIRPIFNDLGMSEATKGFRMLEMCVLEAFKQSQGEKKYYMKNVYPVVAKQFGVGEENCKRLCRYTLSFVDFPRDFGKKYPFLEELTHRTFEKVTTKELVDILVQYLRQVCKFKSK